MNAVTAYALTNETAVKKQISDITLNAFGTAALRIEKLSGFFIGDVYRITTAGKSVILKLASDSNKEMSLEKNSIQAEIKTLNTINDCELAVFPKVLYQDKSKKIINKEYYFIECLPGVPISEISDVCPKEKICNIYSQIGIYTNKVSQNTACYYGSMIDKERRFSRWSDAFLSMAENVCNDAEKSKTALPFDAGHIKNKFKEHSLVLDTVEHPSLVDLNTQSDNFLVDTATDDISGIIDCECPIYGDSLMYASQMAFIITRISSTVLITEHNLPMKKG